MANPIRKIRSFYDETVQEVKKCTWPTREKLIESTIVVIVSTFLLTAFVGGVDIVCKEIVMAILSF